MEAGLKLKGVGISIEGSLLITNDPSHLPSLIEQLGVQAMLITSSADASPINCPQFPIESLEKISYREGKSLKVIVTHGARSKTFQAPWIITHQQRIPDIGLLSQITDKNVWACGSAAVDREPTPSYDDGTRVAELIKNILHP